MNMYNELVMFKSNVLLNKSEILLSFNNVIEYYNKKENENKISEGKKKVLFSLCNEFKKKVVESEIPTLVKPWYCYEYNLDKDSIELNLLKYEEVELSEDGDFEETTCTIINTLVKVKCDYLSVKEYAELHNVSDITVRQWIRRGKIRTAEKRGNNWFIPALTERPTRGYTDVNYYWNELDKEIINEYPYLKNARSLSIYQDEENPKEFEVTIYSRKYDVVYKFTLEARERESLELKLITSPKVRVSEMISGFPFILPKEKLDLPILKSEKLEKNDELNFDEIIIEDYQRDTVHFAIDRNPGDEFNYDIVESNIIPIVWNIWGVDSTDEEGMYNAIYEKIHLNSIKIGTLTGDLVLNSQMVSLGIDTLDICYAYSGDLEYAISALMEDEGPLNENLADPTLNILYIDELCINESLRDKKIGSRILQEIPLLCKELLHVFPEIVAYYPTPTERKPKESDRDKALRKIAMDKFNAIEKNESNKSNIISFAENYKFTEDEIKKIMGRRNSDSSYPEEVKNKKLISFYEKNGFRELSNTRLWYAYSRK